MKKLLCILIALLLGLTVLVSASASNDYTVSDVEIDGLNAIGKTVYVERDSTLNVDAVLNGTNEVNDVKVKAWIGGYEYDNIEDVIGPFDLEAGVARAIHLKLAIPDDLDASETYTLYIEAYDDVNEYSVSYPVKVEEIRHSLKIQDVIFRPGTTVAPGDYLRAVVRVENLGAKKEEDIKVTVKVPELGISQRDYIDELVASENTDDSDEETSQSSNEVLVQIPTNAKAGDYEVVVDIEYNRGHDIVSKKSMIHVAGASEENIEAIISIDSTSKQIAKGTETAYKLMFANLGENSEVYSVSVVGAELWANTRVDPAFITVAPGQTGELFVYLNAKEDAEQGNKMFTVKINSGANTVKEITLNADVTGEEKTNWGSFKNTLEIAFGVLVALLIILGLVIAFKRPKSGNSIEEPDEQTYY